jgi:hypothetical protein
MSSKASNEKVPCKCCAVYHDPTVCAQCHVAGCESTVGQKTHKCRLQGTILHAMQLSTFQLQQRFVELQKENSKLLEELRILRKDYGIQAATPLDAAGVDPNSLRGKVSMLAGAGR